ncbi:hypothetical protein OKW35_000057 [Paraburkholderia sp. MM5477-R1]
MQGPLHRRVFFIRLAQAKAADVNTLAPTLAYARVSSHDLAEQLQTQAAEHGTINSVGKSTLPLNLAYQALVNGHTALFTTNGQMLGELAALDSDSALRRRLHRYATPDVLVIDEVGYLSYSNRHADLLFELISRRYGAASTVVTTNRPFAEWSEVFPNAACVVSLVDRLVHRAEVVAIEGESYRAKEARERAEQRTRSAARMEKKKP